MTRWTFAEFPALHQWDSLLDGEALFSVTHALFTPKRLLECILHGSAFEKYFETSAWAKCRGMGSYVFHWLTVCFQIQFTVLVRTFEVLHGTGWLFEGSPLATHIDPLHQLLENSLTLSSRITSNWPGLKNRSFRLEILHLCHLHIFVRLKHEEKRDESLLL